MMTANEAGLPAINPQDETLSPYFRVMRVVRTELVTQRLRRLVLGGAPLDGFFFECPPDSLAPHVHLEIPPPGITAPLWPRLRGDGSLRVRKASGPNASIERVYSLRWVDHASAEVAIDVVLHGDGPGASFGARALAGDPCGVWWPHGRRIPDADWFLLGADQTGLPGLAWILERLPADCQGRAFVEIPHPDEKQPLVGPQDLEVVWLLPDDPHTLREHMLGTQPPAGTSPFIWFGGEASPARAVRRHVRQVLRFEPDAFEIVNYWRRATSLL